MNSYVANEAESLKYRAPPIIEAVIQFTFAEPLTDGDFNRVAKRFGREYENGQRLERRDAHVDLPNRSTRFEAKPLMRLSSSDEADILTIQVESLSWARLAPYEGWDPFVARASRDFEILHKILGYRKLTRIGVRYINRLDVPRDGPIVRYEDYLKINIAIPEQWETIQNYGWRFEKDFNGLRAIVQSAIAEPEVPETGAFILDIDVINLGDVPARSDALFTSLGEMRMLKNEIFETSITEKARESFKP
jgi:uncharacterized protein (TIGR04255 family)